MATADAGLPDARPAEVRSLAGNKFADIEISASWTCRDLVEEIEKQAPLGPDDTYHVTIGAKVLDATDDSTLASTFLTAHEPVTTIYAVKTSVRTLHLASWDNLKHAITIIVAKVLDNPRDAAHHANSLVILQRRACVELNAVPTALSSRSAEHYIIQNAVYSKLLLEVFVKKLREVTPSLDPCWATAVADGQVSLTAVADDGISWWHDFDDEWSEQQVEKSLDRFTALMNFVVDCDDKNLIPPWAMTTFIGKIEELGFSMKFVHRIVTAWSKSSMAGSSSPTSSRESTPS